MIGAAAAAFTATCFGMLAVLPLLTRAQVLDVPNARSSHSSATPRAGGVAVLFGIFAGALVGSLLNLRFEPWLLAAVLVFAILGFMDDIRGLAVWPRLVAQVATALAIAVGLLGYNSSTAIAAAALATLWLVGFTNAFNFMDGINGISAFNAIFAGAWYAYIGFVREIDVLVGLGVVVSAAAVGFLPWNVPKAKVFLGDTGSYSLGMAIGGLALLAWYNGSTLVEAIAPLVIYLADTTWTLLKRIVCGRSWREAHREHVYQRLADGFGSHLGSALVVTALGAAASLTPFFNAPPLTSVLTITLVVLSYFALPRVVALFGFGQENM